MTVFSVILSPTQMNISRGRVVSNIKKFEISKLICIKVTTNTGIPPSRQCDAVTTVVGLIAAAPHTCAVKYLIDSINGNDVISVVVPPTIFGSVCAFPLKKINKNQVSTVWHSTTCNNYYSLSCYILKLQFCIS